MRSGPLCVLRRVRHVDIERGDKMAARWMRDETDDSGGDVG
jgi:hypothetical protein